MWTSPYGQTWLSLEMVQQLLGYLAGTDEENASGRGHCYICDAGMPTGNSCHKYHVTK